MVKDMQKARIYSSIIKEHLDDYQQMVFLSGPRQAGKTTVSLMAEKYNSKVSYFN